MRPDQVTAYGADYSAREFTPEDLKQYPGVRIDWLARYIGYPGNRKCISYYPGAYQRFQAAGKPVALYHQVEYRDFEGAYNGGRAHAQVAVNDARSSRVGWDGESPILACFDRRMAAFTRSGVTYPAIGLGTVREYMRGFRSVTGTLTGFYGFEDTMGPAVAEGWAGFTMQCGARSQHIEGITAWQENNVQPVLLGTATDRLELYKKISDVFGGDMGIEATDYIEGTDPTQGWKADGQPNYTESQTPGNWWGSAAFNALHAREKVEALQEQVTAMKAKQDAEAATNATFRTQVLGALQGIQTGTGYTLKEIAVAVADEQHRRSES